MRTAVPAVGRSRWILWIYFGGFLVGAAAHAFDFAQNGWLPYAGAPLAINLYWTSLLALDLIVVFLIPLHPRWAALMAVAVMTSDILVDLYAAKAIWHTSILANTRLQGIVIFGGFVLATAPIVWKQPVASRRNARDNS